MSRPASVVPLLASEPTATSGEEGAPSFGKARGRPADDVVLRRREIFSAVVPLIPDGGARRLTMARAARAAGLSVGGLYHRFDSKRSLLLYGLAPENLGRACADFQARWGHVEPVELVSRALDGFSEAVDRWVRPSVDAAGQLGIDVLHGALEDAMTTELVGMVRSVRRMRPDLPDDRAADLERALRRVCTAHVVDPTARDGELREQLRLTVVGALYS
ncbi:TetR/AcrR family transcriptional regulator [Actinomycetospora termitidis]|uniref:Helix-turn-helix domain-containing protein n=1 Tax=Actinomycetospora termitidis TaxID=3053470 RepID=A0ABT7MA22_9PSEU|nr:helix-turn-helix domain-containing protein [Actinomycetospora sp. Odt1-22]MDL5157508.1 helix-turn-helix domain-containing protein [Actinomycetospora sp. Odt1-22]